MTILPQHAEDRAFCTVVLCALVLIFCALVLPSNAQGQVPLQHSAEIVLGRRASAQLVGYWGMARSQERIACLAGHRTDSTVVIDSALFLATDCRGTFGAAGFARSVEQGTETEIIGQLMFLLVAIPEWQFVGVVYGIGQSQTEKGQPVLAPQMLYAYRRPEAALSPPREGP